MCIRDRCKIGGTHTHTTILRPFFMDHPCEPVPEENFWTLWCKGRLTEADTPTIRCKIGSKLVLITNRKSYMSFRLVPKSVTLNGLERRNGPYFCLISSNSVVSDAHCVKVAEDVVVKKFTFAISYPDEFLVYKRCRTCS